MDGRPPRFACGAGLLTPAACATPTITSSASEVAARAPFLHPGQTQLREVVERLGQPPYRHDADRTMIWTVADAPAASDAAGTRPCVELVLQFDATETYVRGSVVDAH